MPSALLRSAGSVKVVVRIESVAGGRQDGSECPLDGARAGKHPEGSRGAADCGGDRESGKARDQGPLPAEQVGDLAAEQQQASEREGVGGHYPLPVAVAEVEGGLRRGKA